MKNTNNKEDFQMFNVIRADASTPVTLQRIDTPNDLETLSFHDISMQYSELQTFPKDLIEDIERIKVFKGEVVEVVFRGEYMYNVLTNSSGDKYLRNSNDGEHREMMIYYNRHDHTIEILPAEYCGEGELDYYSLTNSFETYDGLYDTYINIFDLPVPTRDLVSWAFGVNLKTYLLIQISEHQWNWENGDYIYIERNPQNHSYTLVYSIADNEDTLYFPTLAELEKFLTVWDYKVIWEG